MENFFLDDLINYVDGTVINYSTNKKLSNISIDTRTIHDNDVFFAIVGKTLDGHNFIQEAINKNASVIVYSNNDINTSNSSIVYIKVKDTSIALEQVAKQYKAKFRDLITVAITGSNGKTTTKEILATIFKQKSSTLNNQGNFNNRIGVPLTVFNLTSKNKYAVFELGTSDFGEIKALTNIVCPNHAILTNIGASHLEFFKNKNNVLKEKIQIIDGVSKDGFVAINSDDMCFQKIIPTIKANFITYGFNDAAEVSAKNINLTLEQPTYDLYINNNFVSTLSIAMKGKFNILNSLAAIAISCKLGFSIDEIKNALSNFVPPKMRMQTVMLNNGALAINDAYNANPSSMQNSICSLKDSYPNKDVVLVLGDMLELGDTSNDFHRELGNMINSLDYIKSVYLFGEKVKYIREQITNKKVCLFDTNTETNEQKLFNEIKQDLTTNTVILFKGSRGIKLDKIYENFVTKQTVK